MSLLVPGARPPFIIPYCALCDCPVERFTFPGDRVKNPYYLEIEAKCCGKTQGARISTEEVMRLKRTNQKLYLVVSARRYQGIGEFVRFGG